MRGTRNDDEKNIAVILSKLGYIEKDLSEIKISLRSDYITRGEFKSEFGPIKKGFYGIVTLIVITVLGTVIASVLK